MISGGEIYNYSFTVDTTIYQILRSQSYHVNCAFIWVKIYFRYMFRFFTKPSSEDTFHKLKLLSL
jgi:hypothetical protein